MALSCKCERCEGVRSSAAYAILSTDLNNLDTGLLYLAMSLDKPIVLVTLPESEIPDKLAKVVDRFVEITPGMTAGQTMEAVKAALIDMGIVLDTGAYLGRVAREHYRCPTCSRAIRGYDIEPSQN